MNKINWILRLKNKTTLVTLITASLSFIYLVLGLFDIVPMVTQDQLQQLCLLAVNILVAIGVVVDPTTSGFTDSSQAMEYTEPRKETENAV